jgi:MATE family multidrug resistance protein
MRYVIIPFIFVKVICLVIIPDMLEKKHNIRSDERCGIAEVMSVALPMLVSQACDTVMIFTDRIFLSKVSPEAMNAAMGGGLTSFMLMAFFVGLIGYATALVAQYLGAGQKEKASSVLAQALIVGVAAYPLLLLLRPIAHAMFSWMGVHEAQLVLEKRYFDIVLLGALFGFVRGAFASFFSGLGKTRVVMCASLLTMALNVPLNWLLVFGNWGFPALGLDGSAYATLISSFCGMCTMVVAYAVYAKRECINVRAAFRFDAKTMQKLFCYGSPQGAELLFNIIAFNILVMLFHAHSAVTATAATIMFNWDLVSFLPLIGLEIAVTSLVGRSMGEGQPANARKAVRSATVIGLWYSAIIFVLFVFFTPQIVALFKPAGAEGTYAQAVPMAVFMTRVAALYVTVEVFYFVLVGALRGAGDTFWTMGLTVTLHWLTVMAVWAVLRVLHGSPEAAWGTIVGMFIVFSYVVWLRYKGGAWQSLRVVEPIAPVAVTDGFHETTDV